MPATQKGPKIMMDLETLNRMNAQGCAACGKKFALGETAVLARGPWNGGPKYIHENEAHWDPEECIYKAREN